QDKDYAAFTHQLGVFTGIAAMAIIVSVYQLYLNQMLQIRWRRWLTDHYLDAWLADRAYYRMQLAGGSTDNPDQRIAEDLRVVAAPRFFRGEIRLGGLVQTSLAFGQVQQSLSFIVNAYPDIAEWRAVVNRLIGFRQAIERVRNEIGGIRLAPAADARLSLERV